MDSTKFCNTLLLMMAAYCHTHGNLTGAIFLVGIIALRAVIAGIKEDKQ